MSLFYSIPFETLQLAQPTSGYHTVIVGSGYGAALAALSIAMRDDKSFANEQILVLERGNEYLPGEFPKTLADLPGFISTQGNDEARTGYADALFDVRVGKNVNAIIASGLGGTSLINAGVAVDPDEFTLEKWPQPNEGAKDWMSRLGPSIQFVRSLLNVKTHPNGDSLSKVGALRTLGSAIAHQSRASDKFLKGKAAKPDPPLTTVHMLADIAVSFENGPNKVGVDQRKCSDCGNCFTGCNIGAKNTLAMNAWPLARSLGVTIVTGGNVERIKRGPDIQRPWLVMASRTTDADPSRPSRIAISATRVILAAGTFGSTEILKRSATEDSDQTCLPLSRQLGSRFSLNGDGIAFGFGQRQKVDSYAKVPSAYGIDPRADEMPGPTIVSILKVMEDGGNRSNRGLIEDATIPQAIARLWAEILSTQALTRGYAPGVPSAWHQDHPDQDPLCVSPDLMEHHQPLLMMGVDDASGTLQFDGDPRRDHLQLYWPKRQTDLEKEGDRIERWQDTVLQRAAVGGGFDGGQYLQSPLWQPLPDAFNQVFEGATELGGTHLCNHPLGGCSMAADASSGVVDPYGRVFDSNAGDTVHEGLFVLDGSIIPGALGINPFVTIAALAHYLAGRLDGPLSKQPEVASVKDLLPAPIRYGQKVDWPPPPLGFVFRERLVGPVDPDEEAAVATMLRLPSTSNDYDDSPPQNTVVFDIKIHIPDVYIWLTDPSQPLKADFTLYPNKNWPRLIDTIADADLGAPLAQNVQGVVQLFARDSSKPPKFFRGMLAFVRFLLLRRDELLDVVRGSDSGSVSFLNRFTGFLWVAGQHANWRYFRYSCSMPIGNSVIRVSGEKRLAYDGWSSRRVRDESNLWTTLGNLQFTFENAATGTRARAWFRVDVVRMVEHLAALECTTDAETPQIVAAAANVAALAVRCFVQTHFWSFGAPSYKEFPTTQETIDKYKLFSPPPNITYKGPEGPTEFDVEVPIPLGKEEWRLMKAIPKKPNGAPPVLLIHGISHSSRIFYTDTLKINLAGFLLNQGYDVWLLDHGLSTGLAHAPSYHPPIDEISIQVSKAIRYVYENVEVDRRGIFVFSHCIGAATLSMSILRGDLMDNEKSMIGGLAMHAVPPWIHASAVNLIRAYAGVAFRSRFFPDVINPIPPARRRGIEEPGAFDQLVDRVAFSLPWTHKEYHLHSRCGAQAKFARAICNRMTLFYGYEWLHGNLNKRTHRQFDSLMGPANVDAYRQLYFFVNRGRVTDQYGVNQFVQERYLKQYWTFPTLFLHGKDNDAFNVESSLLSAHQLTETRKGLAQASEVRLKVLDAKAYGHLDVLLGSNAHVDCFGPLSEFFSGLTKRTALPAPKTATLTSKRIMTGPIISRPTKYGNQFQLRIWAETNEFQTSPTRIVEYEYSQSPRAILTPIKWIRGGDVGDKQLSNVPGNTNTLLNSVFWLGDFEVGPKTARIKAVVVGSGGHLTSVGIKGSRLAFNKVSPFRSLQSIGSALPPADITGSTPVPTAPQDSVSDIAIDWTELPWFQRFMSESTVGGGSFVLGSCWYPGSWFDQDRADRIFAKIQDLVVHQPGIDHLLLVGDQIYADASYGILDLAENRERFQQSYRRAFESPWASWVLSHVPTYFAIDDHEFRDNYPTLRPGDCPQAMLELAQAGIQEAWNFQIHSDAAPPVPTNIHDNHLWYFFESGGLHFFVFDTRSERNTKETGLRSIISQTQEDAFVAWAASLSPDGRPALLVTGSPLAPVPSDEMLHSTRASTSDGLRAYPDFVELIGRIMRHRQKTLILLSGDPHFSSMCEFTLSGLATQWSMPCISIISSGVNVPLPFANDLADDYTWNIPQPTFQPFPPAVALNIGCSTILSNSRSHVLRVALTQAADSSWSLSVAAIEADAVVQPQPVVRNLPI